MSHIDVPGGGGTTSATVTSNRISTLSQAISVISQQVSALSQAHSALSQAHSALSQAVSVLSNQNSVEHAALSVRIDGVGGGGSVTSNELSAAAAALSVRVDTQSQGISVISQQVSALSQAVSVLSNQNSVEHAALSVRIDTVSNVHSALSQAVSVLSNVVSNELSVRAASVQTASAAATSVLAYVCAVSARTTGATSVKGLQSVVDALSSRISAIGVPGGASVTSNELSAKMGGLSIQGRVLAADQAISSNTLVTINGLSAVVSAGGRYKLEAMIAVNRGAAAAASAPIRLGLSFPAMKYARGYIRGNTSLAVAQMSAIGFGVSVGINGMLWDGDSASGSVLASITVSMAIISMHFTIEGLMVCSVTGTVVMLGAMSATQTTGAFLEGSYMLLHRLPE